MEAILKSLEVCFYFFIVVFPSLCQQMLYSLPIWKFSSVLVMAGSLEVAQHEESLSSNSYCPVLLLT